MTPGGLTRAATTADLPSIVAVHEAAFAGFFLTLLGRRFLRELYRGFIVERDGICQVTEMDATAGGLQIVGFVAGTSKPELFFRRLLFRRALPFALAAIPGLARHPLAVLPRLLRAVSYRGERPPVLESAALLSSLAVHPQVARHGAGTALVEAFCDGVAALGAHVVYLTTDERENDAAKIFYERAGFRAIATTKRHDGRVMNTYVRTIQASQLQR